jgi:predicted O-methyltransferase YrrM
MDDLEIARLPAALEAIEADTHRLDFDMPSERRMGAFLRCLAASKIGGHLLELGTGTGLSTAWLLDGMDRRSTLVSIESEPSTSAVAARHLGQDPRLTLVVADANDWLRRHQHESMDLIFADAIQGKYENFDLAWNCVAQGGFYVIDDMLPQENWPQGHGAHVQRLLADLDRRTDCQIVRLGWSSGLVLVARS